MKIKFKVGDLVKVSKESDQIYRISWLGDCCACQIEAKKANGGWYSPQSFDTGCLFLIK